MAQHSALITFLLILSCIGDIVSYLAGMLHETGLEDMDESIGPFLEGYGCDDTLVHSCREAVMLLQCGANGNGNHRGAQTTHSIITTNGSSNNEHVHSTGGAVKLKQGIVSMSSVLSDQSEAEIDANRYMWGQDRWVIVHQSMHRLVDDSYVANYNILYHFLSTIICSGSVQQNRCHDQSSS